MLLPPDPPQPPQGRPHHELVVPRHDVQWCRPVFRAPRLPGPQQLYREIPFSAVFPAKRFAAGDTETRA